MEAAGEAKACCWLGAKRGGCCCLFLLRLTRATRLVGRDWASGPRYLRMAAAAEEVAVVAAESATGWRVVSELRTAAAAVAAAVRMRVPRRKVEAEAELEVPGPRWAAEAAGLVEPARLAPGVDVVVEVGARVRVNVRLMMVSGSPVAGVVSSRSAAAALSSRPWTSVSGRRWRPPSAGLPIAELKGEEGEPRAPGALVVRV